MPEFTTLKTATPYALRKHIARYEFVKAFCYNKKVIDVGCGSGYGTALLGTVAKTVCGIDRNLEALSIAQKRWPHLHWVQGDAHGIPLKESWDVLVMLEVLEHLDEPELALRNLSYASVTFISTPAPPKHGQSDYHVKEYDLDELQQLLDNWFGHVTILAQKEHWFGIDPCMADYYMAICL